jgi:hypothetical protein
MLTSVDLNDEPLLKADEIENIASNRHLSAELTIGQPAVPQQFPRRAFRRGLTGTHSFSEPAAALRDNLM